MIKKVSAATAALLLSLVILGGCSSLADLDIVYDLTQQDQQDAYFELFNSGEDNGGSLVILGPESAAPEHPAAVVLEPLPAAQEEPDTGIVTEDVEQKPEPMELPVTQKSREQIEREDEEKRQAIGLTEDAVLETIAGNMGNYYFDQLDDKNRHLYAEILWIIEKRGEKIKVASLDENEIDRAFQYVTADHPELFYVDGYTYTRYTIGGELVKLGFTARYTYDADETKAREARIDVAVESIVGAAPTDADEYYKAKYVYDYIIDHTEYETGAPDNQNICSVFLSGRSVCQGYAKAAQLLLNRLGVKATLVTGKVNAGDRPTTLHAWNLVRVNGHDYFMDPTWGDSSFQQAATDENVARRINYDYLLDTTEDLMNTHMIDDLVEMPVCTHLEDNYYVRDGAYFTGADPDGFRELFDRAYSEGRGDVTVKCANESAYQAVTQYLITDRRLFDYLRTSGNSASFVSSDTRRTITFVL